MKDRFTEIDDMRGLAMLVMILIHTNAYFLSDKIAATLWNWSQFAVPVFLFCSAYIYYRRKHENALKDFLSYLKKRFSRLLIPYYIFAAIYIIIRFFKEPTKITDHYLLQSLFLTGGIDINWLILLFLFLTFLMPILAYFQEKQKKLFYAYTGIAILSSFLFIFYHWPFDYRIIMWLPWSLLLIYSMYFVRYHTKQLLYFFTLLFSGILFFILLFIEIKIHHSLTFYDNKYPPNAFILSYGIGSIAVLYYISKIGTFSLTPIKQLLHFLSFNSYELYFIHYIFLYLFSFSMWQWHWNWLEYFLAVLSASLVTQWILNFVRQAFVRSR